MALGTSGASLDPGRPTLQAFFTERLTGQRQASPHTVAYRDSFRQLFAYMVFHDGKPPAQLDFDDFGAQAMSGFLRHLQARPRAASHPHRPGGDALEPTPSP